MEYSGRTTYNRVFDEDGSQNKPKAPSAIQTVTVFNAQWTDCPVEVEVEVKRLWKDHELSNDNCYYQWNRNGHPDGDMIESEADKNIYPIIDEYLMSKGVENCLIHWWW